MPKIMTPLDLPSIVAILPSKGGDTLRIGSGVPVGDAITFARGLLMNTGTPSEYDARGFLSDTPRGLKAYVAVATKRWPVTTIYDHPAALALRELLGDEDAAFQGDRLLVLTRRGVRMMLEAVTDP